MDTFDLLVVFKDGSEVVIEGVTNYFIKYGENSLAVGKNDRYQFFNWDEIRYVGRLSDLR